MLTFQGLTLKMECKAEQSLRRSYRHHCPLRDLLAWSAIA